MTEPLAATLLFGAALVVLADPLGRGRDCGGAGSLPGRCSARSPWSGPSTWRSSARCYRWRRSSASAHGAVAGARLRRRASCSPGSSSSSRPGRSATRSPSIASSPSRPAAARCSTPAPTCPPAGNPEKVGAAVVDATRRCSARTRSKTSASSRSSPGSPQTATPNSNPTRPSPRWARNSSGTTSPSSRRIRRVRRQEDRPDLVPRPPRGDARAGLGGPPLGAPRPRPARPRPPRLATPLGGAPDRRRLPRGHPDQRPPRRLPPPRPGGDPPVRRSGRGRRCVDMVSARARPNRQSHG